VNDLVPSIGQPHRVYGVLNGKRGLSLEMIRNWHRNLGIPAESLIGVGPTRTCSPRRKRLRFHQVTGDLREILGGRALLNPRRKKLTCRPASGQRTCSATA
jgi:hypothetical protein